MGMKCQGNRCIGSNFYHFCMGKIHHLVTSNTYPSHLSIIKFSHTGGPCFMQILLMPIQFTLDIKIFEQSEELDKKFM